MFSYLSSLVKLDVVFTASIDFLLVGHTGNEVIIAIKHILFRCKIICKCRTQIEKFYIDNYCTFEMQGCIAYIYHCRIHYIYSNRKIDFILCSFKPNSILKVCLNMNPTELLILKVCFKNKPKINFFLNFSNFFLDFFFLFFNRRH